MAAVKPKDPAGVAACECGRIGYMLVLCQEHAPIPYVLTERGTREARKMRQWDAIFSTLEARRRDGPAFKAWETRRRRTRAIGGRTLVLEARS